MAGVEPEQAQKWAELRILEKKRPTRRSHHSAVLFGESMYIFGGRGAWDEKLNDVWMYSFEYESWECGDPSQPPLARSHHTASIHGDLMYVFGGQSADLSCIDDFIVLEMNEMKWNMPRGKDRDDKSRPPPRDSHSAICLDGGESAQLLIIGGIDDGGNALIDVHVWDLAGGGFSELKMNGELPPGRYGHTNVAASSQEALVFGGVSITGEKINDLWTLNAETATWIQVQSLGVAPQPRFGHSACVHGSVMVVFGGTLSGAEATNDLFCLGIGTIGHGPLEWRERQGFSLSSQNDDNIMTQESTNTTASANNSQRLQLVQHGNRKPRVKPAQRVIDKDESAVIKMIFGIDTGKSGSALAPSERVEGRVCSARDGHTAVVYDGMVFIFGGERQHMKFDDLFVYKV